MALVFSKFGELGGVRQTHRWFHEQRIELPRGARFELLWQLPTMSFVNDVLHNPLYAGAYVYGRRPIEVVVNGGEALKHQRSARPPEDAGVFIQAHHVGYVDWDLYQRHQDVMRNNGGNFTKDDASLAVRCGQGLLSGLLRRARCGRKLHIRYWGKSGTAARYYLRSGDFATGGAYCLGFGGATLDQRLSELIVELITARARGEYRCARTAAYGSDRRGALERHLQQARYAAERAFAHYDQVDPNNSRIAEVLEQRCNSKLEQQQQLERELQDLSETTATLSPGRRGGHPRAWRGLRQACRYLVKDFGTSQSPKSTRLRDSHWCPGRPASVPLRHTLASLGAGFAALPQWLDAMVGRLLCFPCAASRLRVNSAPSSLPGTTGPRFALHGRQRTLERRRVFDDAEEADRAYPHQEIMVDLDAAAQRLSLVIHWHGGCHTAFTMPKPRSGAVAHKSALEDVELITRMARRYRDDEIARVLSKLGRRTGKGNRWTLSRVASVRRKYRIATPDAAQINPDVLNLAQATSYSGVKDTTLMRLIKAGR